MKQMEIEVEMAHIEKQGKKKKIVKFGEEICLNPITKIRVMKLF